MEANLDRKASMVPNCAVSLPLREAIDCCSRTRHHPLGADVLQASITYSNAS
jgi:hypothetical protein